jgi:hypothetical protein
MLGSLVAAAMSEAKDAVNEAIGDQFYRPWVGNMKRIGLLADSLKLTKWYHHRRRRNLHRLMYNEASQGYWIAPDPQTEAVFKAIMELTKDHRKEK